MNLTDKIPGCEHFTWKDAIWLPSWNRAATEADGLTPDVVQNLIKVFQKMEVVRAWIGRPIRVHVGCRPSAYNTFIYAEMNKARVAKGQAPLRVTTTSPHISGEAVDFDVIGMTCDAVVAKILAEGKLKEWHMRMEHNPAGSEWVHLDIRAVGPGGEYFFP